MSSDVRSMMVFWATAIALLVCRVAFQKLLEREPSIQSEKYNNLIDLAFFLITLAIPFLIEIEKDSDAIIVPVIIYGMYYYTRNSFKINEDLKSLNDDYRKILCDPAYAFKANKKFSEKLQDESYRVTKHYYEKQDTLEARLRGEFPDSATTVDRTVDRETAKLLLSIVSGKSISALDQFGRGKIFLRRELFKDFWEKAIQSSSSYLSICDLSMYSGKNDSEINTEKINWKTRVKDEIEALKGGQIRIFDKIILFESSQDGQNGSNNIIFNEVAKLWKSSMGELNDLDIKSHCQSENGNRMIWQFSRDDFSSCLMNINSSEVKGQINSNDLGIYGDHLIGEEFKVNEVSTIIGELRDNDLNELKFLYRLSIQKDLVEQIKTMAIGKMDSYNRENHRA